MAVKSGTLVAEGWGVGERGHGKGKGNSQLDPADKHPHTGGNKEDESSLHT